MSTNVISLVSIGAHPPPAAPRRAEQDARAVELGLQLAGDNLQVLHAGDIAEPALRAYLGMGLRNCMCWNNRRAPMRCRR
jgi:electron transfer flavoprotein beta subunit